MRKRLPPNHPLIRIETKFGNAEVYGSLSMWALMAVTFTVAIMFLAALIWGYSQ